MTPEQIAELERLIKETNTKSIAALANAAPALLADWRRMREALESVARGPFTPPPDPGAHSWQAWGRFWHEQVDRLRLIARAALEPSP